MNKRTRTPMNGDRLFQGVVKSPDYQAQINKGRTRAFGAASVGIAERLTRSETRHSVKIVDQLRVAGQIESYAYAAKKLREEKTMRGFNRNEHDKNTRITIKFENTLEDMLSHDQNVKRPEVLKFLTSVYDRTWDIASTDEYYDVEQDFQSSLTEVSHRVVGTQLARGLGYISERPTVEQQLAGIDTFLKVDNSWHAVGFRSTEENAREARTRSADKLILWNPVSSESYRDRLHITQEQIVVNAPKFQEEIDSELKRLGYNV